MTIIKLIKPTITLKDEYLDMLAKSLDPKIRSFEFS